MVFMLKKKKIQLKITIIKAIMHYVEIVVCDKEIEEMMQQIYSAACKVEAAYELPDLSTALRQIQSQYDIIAAKNLQVGCHFLVFVTHLQTC